MKNILISLLVLVIFYFLIPRNIGELILQLLGAFYLGNLSYNLANKITGEN